MYPSANFHAIHSYETVDHSVFTESPWISELVINDHLDSFLLTANAPKRNDPANGYVLLLLLTLLIAISYLIRIRIIKQNPSTSPTPPNRSLQPWLVQFLNGNEDKEVVAPSVHCNRSAYTSSTSASSHSLHPRLVQLLNGDEGAAHRLLRHSYIKHPTRSQQWHYEHVISDIIRDRR